MKTDIQINQETKKIHIKEVAKKLNLSEDQYQQYGNTKAKLEKSTAQRKAQLILVTAINPTRAGEGKTTTSIALNEALVKLDKKSVVVLREPSLGPVFGLKGGATGGGQVQIAPIEDINLHFTGDLHAITTANNLLAAAIDSSMYWGNPLQIEKIAWKRCIDMNDRALRNITLKTKKNETRGEHFQITAASEMMAILTLAKDLEDLGAKVDKAIVGYTAQGKPVFAKDINVTGSIKALLKEAIKPNLVQTLEHNPAIVHGGPFANIAHGCNSIIATDFGMKQADYVITEAGFGADLGAEKFLNIKAREADLNPNVVVIVATIRALKMQGGLSMDELTNSNIAALTKGMAILDKHIDNIKAFNTNYVVALNEFATDSDEEKQFIKDWATKNNHPFAFNDGWAKGGEGAIELANLVLDNLSDKKVKFTYELEDSIESKVNKIAKEIYGAKDVEFSPEASEFIKLLEKNNLDKQYICVAKTPASITDNPKIMGTPTDWILHVNKVSVSNGAGLIIVYCGTVMTMPGLSKKPRAEFINVVDDKIVGLD